MNIHTIIDLAMGYFAGTYLYDVVLRPIEMGKKAQRESKRLGKPMLNIGCGTPSSSVRVAWFGKQLWGDINIDLAGTEKIPANLDQADKNVVYKADAEKLPFPDKYFGVAFSSHLLEHTRNPQKVLKEMHRVADSVIAVTPSWWCLHSYLWPDHRWYIKESGKAIPMWHNVHELGEKYL